MNGVREFKVGDRLARRTQVASRPGPRWDPAGMSVPLVGERGPFTNTNFFCDLRIECRDSFGLA